MSVGLLQSLDFASQFKIAQANVDPVTANTDGVLLLANGHTDLPSVPNMYYEFRVDASSNVLTLTGQKNAPVPPINVFSVDPDSGRITFDASGSDIQTDSIVITAPSGPDPQSATLHFVTDASNGQSYIWYANTGGGAGLEDAHLQLFSYNNDVPVSEVLDIAPPTASASASLTFNGPLVTPSSGGFRLSSVPSVTSSSGIANVGSNRQGIAIFNTLASVNTGDTASVTIQSSIANLTYCQCTVAFDGYAATSIPVVIGYPVTSSSPSLVTVQWANVGAAPTGAGMTIQVNYSFCQ